MVNPTTNVPAIALLISPLLSFLSALEPMRISHQKMKSTTPAASNKPISSEIGDFDAKIFTDDVETFAVDVETFSINIETFAVDAETFAVDALT